MKPLACLSLATCLFLTGFAAAQAPERRLTHPEWDRKPTGEEIAEVMNQIVRVGDPVGWALLKCSATATGDMTRCRVIVESPEHGDIGRIALRLTRTFKLKPVTRDGLAVEGGTVLVPVVLGSPDVGTPTPSYAPGRPSFTISPVIGNKPNARKILCPMGEDKTVACEARPFYWADTAPLEETAPTILAAGQTTGVSTLYCHLTIAGRFENCQLEGENNARVLAAVGKTLATLQSPKRYGSDEPVAPAVVAIAYDWATLTRAAQAIVEADVAKTP